MTAVQTFGAWLKMRRRHLDLTQQELADGAHCSVYTIRKIEQDVRRPSKQLAESMATALQVSTDRVDAFVTFARQDPGSMQTVPSSLEPTRTVALPTADSATVQATPILPAESDKSGSLPRQTTPFLGRETDVRALIAYMDDPDISLVSVLGPGGIGKTRLALAAAERLAETDRFSQGVYFVALAPLNEDGSIMPTIADVVGLKIQMAGDETRSPKEQLLDYLRAKNILLLLDNFEHLLSGAALLDEIRYAAPGLQIIVTSRERLGLSGEQLFPIEGLAYTIHENSKSEQSLSAVQLFLQCAQRVVPGFATDNKMIRQIHDICGQVQGMPLAIELAASWVDLLTLAELKGELQRSLDILEAESKGGPERHRSMRAVFDATWHRLDETEQEVLAGLSLFRGGFTRKAAEEVAGASLRQLRILSSKSIIQFDQTVNRYSIHELLRQYGAERLAMRPNALYGIRRRYSAHYCRLAKNLGEDLLGVHQMDAISSIEMEAENLRQAWQLAVDQRNWILVNQAMDGLGIFYQWHGRLDDGKSAMKRAYDALDRPDDKSRRGQAAIWCSIFVYSQGLVERADRLLAEALDLLEGSSDDSDALAWRAFAWLQSGNQTYYRDDHRARKSYSRSLCLYRKLNNKWGSAHALSGLAQAEADDGNYAIAAVRFEEAFALLKEIGDRRSEAHILHRLAITLVNLGRIDEATARASLSHRLYTEIADRTGIVWSSQILAECRHCNQDFESAKELLRMAETIASDLGDKSRLANIYLTQAFTFWFIAQYHEARMKAEAGIALAQQLGQKLRVAWFQFALVLLDIDGRDYEAAEQRIQEAGEIMSAQNRPELAIVYGLQALVALGLQNPVLARDYTLDSLYSGLQNKYHRLTPGLSALTMILADAGRQRDALAVITYMDTMPVGREYVPATRRWLEKLIGPLPSDDTMMVDSQHRGTDLWDFVAHWVTELEQMGRPDVN